MPPVAVAEAAVRALLARWFPGQIRAVERIGSGGSTPVYRVNVDGEIHYLRLGESPGERRNAEVRVHELLRGRGVAAPAIVRWEQEPPELARINAIPVVGYGWVDAVAGDDRHLVAEHPTRAAWAAGYVVAAETVIAAGALADAWRPALRDAIRAWAEWPDRAPSALAHGDFDASHIYVDPETGAYEGIIDFGEIRGADPSYDLGHALVQAGDARGQATFDGLVAGYREVAPVDLHAVRVQAVAIATRGLAIQLGRAPKAYRDFLAARLGMLLGDGR